MSKKRTLETSVPVASVFDQYPVQPILACRGAPAKKQLTFRFHQICKVVYLDPFHHSWYIGYLQQELLPFQPHLGHVFPIRKNVSNPTYQVRLTRLRYLTVTSGVCVRPVAMGRNVSREANRGCGGGDIRRATSATRSAHSRDNDERFYIDMQRFSSWARGCGVSALSEILNAGTKKLAADMRFTGWAVNVDENWVSSMIKIRFVGGQMSIVV